ncbi:hypothetical protein LAWI1_G006775 [Lachnellula willkommii]|uniref:Carcinoembryonic antigen-related cell adhesion molecule n=1 Tax=Lachnellula willkommii TaxID=215461 RepID=A0A559LZD9_9HELO|nr:hypothetical protein LAWI1_G006775 [Lachnellula willkommii]
MARMTWHICLGIVALIQITPISAISWAAASSTTFSANPSSTSDLNPPSTTSGPPIGYGNTTSQPPELCGYVNHNSLNSYTCGGNNTCFWNSDLRLVGCGHATSVNYITSCIPYVALKYCNDSCFSNPSIIRWYSLLLPSSTTKTNQNDVQSGSSIPHCVTPILGPHANYSIFACAATKNFYGVHLTFFGQSTTGYLPRYLGEDGAITYGTRIPENSTSASGSSVSADTDFGVGTVVLVSTVTAPAPGESGGAGVGAGKENGGLRVNKSLVVGVVLGGGILVTVVVVLGVFLWAYRRREVRSKGEGTEGTELSARDAEGEHVL